MTILILTLLVVAAIAVLIYPFWKARHGSVSLDDLVREMESSLRRARERVYEEIRVLQQEYFLGNMTEDEYRAQLQSARQRAAELIREQQQVRQTAAAIENRVDAELLELTQDADARDGREA